MSRQILEGFGRVRRFTDQRPNPSVARNQKEKPNMKSIRTLALAAAVALMGASAAFADNQQLQNQLALQRQAAQRNQTTVAVYAHRHGVGHRTHARRAETRFELRTNAKGQQFGVFVPVR
jgi:hypothetical protein